MNSENDHRRRLRLDRRLHDAEREGLSRKELAWIFDVTPESVPVRLRAYRAYLEGRTQGNYTSPYAREDHRECRGAECPYREEEDKFLPRPTAETAGRLAEVAGRAG